MSSAEDSQDPKSPTDPKSEESSAAVTEETAPAPSAEERETSTLASSERKQRRKKKKKAEPVEPSSQRPALDRDGRERPAFLLEFPEDPDLERLIGAFEAGNYRLVRDEGPALVSKSDQPQVRAAAQELLRRIEPDPLVKFLLAVAIALFFAVIAYAYRAQL